MKKILLFLTFVCCIIFCTVSAQAGNYVEGEVLVLFKSQVESGIIKASSLENDSFMSTFNSVVKNAGASVKKIYPAISESENSVFMQVKSETKSTLELISEFSKRDDVISVSPNRISHVFSTPNDPYYISGDLWGLDKINAPQVWEDNIGSENVYVAVLDTGCYQHEDLKDNIATEYAKSFIKGEEWYEDKNGHGTHIAGTIGAVGNNNLGVSGVAWKVKIIPLKVGNADGEIEDADIISALNYLVSLLNDNPEMKLAAVNMSYGGYVSHNPEYIRQRDIAFRAYRALDKLNRTIMIMAAGNEGIGVGIPAPFTEPEFEWTNIYGLNAPQYNKGDYIYPAAFTGINHKIVVGAVASDDSAPFFTNWGNGVDVSAPGDDILSTYQPYAEDNEEHKLYELSDGTSMATPHVVGAAALLMSKYPEASPYQIKNSILEGANSDLNPLVYPYEKRCTNFINGIIEALTEDGSVLTDKEIQNIKNMTRNALISFASLDGKSKVSRKGFLDIAKSIEVLSQKVANNQDYDAPEIKDNFIDEVETTQRYSRSGGSGGCNSIGILGIYLLLAVMLILNPVFRLKK